MKSVLFVCLGNICRSPMAEGVFAAELAKRGISGVTVESAGTGSWHVGDPPDPRAISAAAAHGIHISGQRARQFETADFDRFDLIVAMDQSNRTRLGQLAPSHRHSKKLAMMLDFASRYDGDVPDPWSGSRDGFTTVMAMLEDSCAGLADHLVQTRS